MNGRIQERPLRSNEVLDDDKGKRIAETRGGALACVCALSMEHLEKLLQDVLLR